VVFTHGYLENDPNAPLKINVSPSNFYRYLEGGSVIAVPRSILPTA